MKKTKFRIWDKLNKKMIYLNNRHHSLYFDIGGNAKFMNLQNGSGGSEYELMQFTGLKDRDGKEIYEGDIVKMNSYIEDYEDTIDIDFIGEVVIIASKGVCIKNPKIIDNINEFKGENHSYKNIRRYRTIIIGNIYENFELLNK